MLAPPQWTRQGRQRQPQRRRPYHTLHQRVVVVVAVVVQVRLG